MDCLAWVKEQLKVMLKAKNIVIDQLYAFKVAVSSLRLYLNDLLSHESLVASSTSTCSSILEKFLVLKAATDAEIRWCLKNVVSSYSFRSCDGLTDLSGSMFPGSTIAEKFCLQIDKYAYFINYGIAPHFCSILMNNVKDSEFYTISFDESLNTVIQI